MRDRELLKLSIAVLFFWGMTRLFGGEAGSPANQERYLNPPPEHIERFHFGFNESFADSLWLRWIQDADTCQTYLPKKSIDEWNPGESLGFDNPRYKICDYSWAFQMLNAITKLAPLFKMPYLAGATALSVLVEDYEGAKIIFDRGLKVHPDDWVLAYRAAYHYLFDRKDLTRAAELLNQAAAHGAPTWLRSLAARLYTRTGQLQLGISSLMAYRETLTDEKAKAEVDRRLQEMRRQLYAQP